MWILPNVRGGSIEFYSRADHRLAPLYILEVSNDCMLPAISALTTFFIAHSFWIVFGVVETRGFFKTFMPKFVPENGDSNEFAANKDRLWRH